MERNVFEREAGVPQLNFGETTRSVYHSLFNVEMHPFRFSCNFSFSIPVISKHNFILGWFDRESHAPWEFEAKTGPWIDPREECGVLTDC